MNWLQHYHEKDPSLFDLAKLSELQVESQKKAEQKINIPFDEVIKNLPEVGQTTFNAENKEINISGPGGENLLSSIKSLAKDLIPWRKGPFNLFGMEIDAEWRSDKKWNRLLPHLPNLSGKRVLDVGCNNGYFMFKMAQHNPEFVLGIDPIFLNYAQFSFINHFAKKENLHFELWGQEDLIHFNNMFDVVFSMGVIYHHRNPIQQLLTLKKAIRPGGTLILETIGIPGEESYALFPEDRYAKMRNVWFLPTQSCFINWVKRAKFKDVEFLVDSDMTFEEQRLTQWCPPPRQSLEDFLDSKDPSKTIEGYPAPRRFILKAKV